MGSGAEAAEGRSKTIWAARAYRSGLCPGSLQCRGRQRPALDRPRTKIPDCARTPSPPQGRPALTPGSCQALRARRGCDSDSARRHAGPRGGLCPSLASSRPARGRREPDSYGMWSALSPFRVHVFLAIVSCLGALFLIGQVPCVIPPGVPCPCRLGTRERVGGGGGGGDLGTRWEVG